MSKVISKIGYVIFAASIFVLSLAVVRVIFDF